MRDLPVFGVDSSVRVFRVECGVDVKCCDMAPDPGCLGVSDDCILGDWYAEEEVFGGRGVELDDDAAGVFADESTPMRPEGVRREIAEGAWLREGVCGGRRVDWLWVLEEEEGGDVWRGWTVRRGDESMPTSSMASL